jgi:Reverse transcriptase (RNA-dependent DNA polymerase)
LQRVKKKLLRRKSRDHSQQMLDGIEELRYMSETRKFYRAIGNAKKGFQPRSTKCRKKNGELTCDLNGVLDRWKEHFDDLLNANTDEAQKESRKKQYETDDGKEFSNPSREEVVAAIKNLKNHKAPGDDMLFAELFKAGGDRLIDVLHGLILQVWSEEKLPEEWKTGVICPLHKKGCKLDCSNYRGISLLPTAYKGLSRVLSARLEPLLEKFLQSYQAGFRKGMSTMDQIFCLRLIALKSHEMNTETLHLFIDFKQANDTINREELWAIMTQFGFPHKLIRLLKATLQGVWCCVKIQGSLSGFFESKIGLRQGDELSTKLSNIALEGIVRRSGVETTGSIFNKFVQLLGHADDIDIVSRNIRSLTDAFSRLEREANRIGLHVNESKTKLMMIRPSQRNRALIGKQLEVGDKKFEVVEEFPYLSVLVNDKFETSLEIKRRLVSAQRAFYSVNHMLSSRRTTRSTKFAIYNTLMSTRPAFSRLCFLI